MHFSNWSKGLGLLLVTGITVFTLFSLLKPLNADDTSNESGESAKKQPKTPVHATVVNPEALSNTLDLTGTIIPEQSVSLKTETSGRITALPLEEGNRVAKGERLLTINNAELKAQLRQAQQQKDFLQQQLQRKAKLLEKNGISQEAYDKTQTELASQKAQVDLLKAKIDKTTIHAPFNGSLGLKHVSVGSYVSPETVVIRLVQSQPVKLHFSIPGKYASLIKKGQPLTFRPSNKDTTLQAAIHAIEPVIDEGTRQLRVRARYPNTNRLLKAGSFVNIKLNLTTDPNALMVPSMAVIPELDGKKLYVYKNGKTYPRSIQTAQRSGDQVQVVKGLKAGDTVISKGIQKIKKGTAVSIQAFTN